MPGERQTRFSIRVRIARYLWLDAGERKIVCNSMKIVFDDFFAISGVCQDSPNMPTTCQSGKLESTGEVTEVCSGPDFCDRVHLGFPGSASGHARRRSAVCNAAALLRRVGVGQTTSITLGMTQYGRWVLRLNSSAASELNTTCLSQPNAYENGQRICGHMSQRSTTRSIR